MERTSWEGLEVSRETTELLQAFVGLLMQWNRRINLVNVRSVEDLWQRHIADSVQLAGLLPPGPAPLLDLGSGAGFPGLVLAATTRRRTILVEADKRKAAFLTSAAAQLGLTEVEVHARRIEEVRLAPVPLLTARALARLPSLLRYAHRLLAPCGIAILPKGRAAEEELTDAARDWMMRVERFPSRTDSAATIFRISEIRPAGRQA